MTSDQHQHPPWDSGLQAERTSLHPGDAVGLDILPSSYHLFDRNGRTIAAAH